MKKFVYYFCWIGWFISSLISVNCIFQGFKYSLGAFFGFIVAIVLGEMPFLGQIMGIIGATKVYHWSFGVAFVRVALLPLLFLLLIGLIGREQE